MPLLVFSEVTIEVAAGTKVGTIHMAAKSLIAVVNYGFLIFKEHRL